MLKVTYTKSPNKHTNQSSLMQFVAEYMNMKVPGRVLLQVCVMLVTVMLSQGLEETTEVDPKGYVAYCPCMGRFGNQADHFLGSLAFAKALDRTLILPPWVEYKSQSPRSVQVPYKTYFKVEPLLQYHRVVTMEHFMKELAPTVWPAGQRTVYCYQARDFGGKSNDCNAKEGNPFGPFWDTFNIDFDRSEFYSPLYHEVGNPQEMQRWRSRFSAQDHPVLAFTGAPARFPVQAEHVKLQKYVQWSDEYIQKRDSFIQEHIGDQKYVGIHLRIGSDFENACAHLDQSPMLFGAAQCVGYRMEHGKPTRDMCIQSVDVITRDLKVVLKDTGYNTVFVGTDSKDLITQLQKKFKKVTFIKGNPLDPHLDLAVLGKSDFFIGNCISTFTAFVKRERDVNGLPSKFWAFTPKDRDEL